MFSMTYEWFDENFKIHIAHDFPIPKSDPPKKPQVVTATINSALSREREPENEPARLQQKKEVKALNKVVVKMEQIRKAKGITKKHISEYCGKSQSWYSDISIGRIRVTLDDFLLIAEAMGEDAKNFFDYAVSVTRSKRAKSA